MVEARTLVTLLSKPSNTNRSVREDTSIKHDLGRSCSQLWPKIGDEGDKISRKKLARRLPRQFFLEILSPSEPILRAMIENMISPDYVLCYIPRAMAILS